MQIFDYGPLWSIQPSKVNTTQRKDFLESKMGSVFPVLNKRRMKLLIKLILFIYLSIYLFFF